MLLVGVVAAYANLSIATGWAVPDKISDLPSTVGGALVTGDSAGNVYAVWLANSEGKSEDQVDTVYFRHWNGTEWSPSVDILAAMPGGPWLRVDKLVLDAYGRLVLLWHQDRQLVVSVAEPLEAVRANGWRSIPLSNDQLVYESDLVAGPDGALHVLAIEQGQNVYYLRSNDAGETWATVQLSAGNDPTRQYSWGSLALAPDGSGTLHASWTENREDNKWLPTGVYVARSLDDGATWSEPDPVMSAPGHGHSTVMASSGGNVMVFWNRNVGSVDGRYFVLSTDQGETWGQPQAAYEGVSGLTLPPYLFTDSLGQTHMIGAGFGAGNEHIWYSRWDASHWTEPGQIVVDGRSMAGNESFDAKLVGGNRLLYTWTEAATKDIWFTSQTLPGPSVPETRLELPAPAAATPGAQVSVATLAATPAPAPTRAVLTESGPQPTTSLTPLVAGALPAVLLVAVVVALSVRRRRA